MLKSRALVGNRILYCGRSSRLITFKQQNSRFSFKRRFSHSNGDVKNVIKQNENVSTKEIANSTLSASEVKVVCKEAEAEALAFLAERGNALGTPLTLSERRMILKEAGLLQKSGLKIDKTLTQSEWQKLVSRQKFTNQERLTLNDFIAKSHDGAIGQTLLLYAARCGAAFFAVTGAHIAGESGMHVFGSTMVGCITALGGRTINDLLLGNTPVSWVKNPSFLILAGVSSLVGFYAWPLAEEAFLKEGLEGKDDGREGSQRQYFQGGIDDNNGFTNAYDTDKGPSVIRYTFESIALGTLAVVGAQQGIVRSLHPLVSASLGVTIAFGGVFRDLLCRRDLSLGAATGCQSYGIASFSGAAVYVALRELHVWNCAGSTSKLLHGGIPIGFRIFCGFGTAVAIRTVAWMNKPDGLFLTMEESAVANKRKLDNLGKEWR